MPLLALRLVAHPPSEVAYTRTLPLASGRRRVGAVRTLSLSPGAGIISLVDRLTLRGLAGAPPGQRRLIICRAHLSLVLLLFFVLLLLLFRSH